ncbi:HPr family phosphocarrier protein [Zophobihabitans entericus]|uniref:HPr family phosphocarrier protein n=1 Tax=Zophobihabitans entericus TaxID=1635327 RepID=A0A6G9I8B7_9GAMM|nr:HPr family phosphocarrier protein [Zophobihabitans entericus]QIQ20455.1 HPr family phosphocarrier protein [Zophobihabitans entericus]
MIEKTLIVRNHNGIHAKPAGMIVRIAGQYQASAELVFKGQTIDAKKIMQLMSFIIPGGAELKLICRGPDEKPLSDQLEALFADGFGEE